jgi:acetylornithine deacetylase/succinyl-diaminopimelate desuccinylase-like protein
MSRLAFVESRFVERLRQLISHTPALQNAPHVGLVPREVLASQVVEDALAPLQASGFLSYERIAGPLAPERPSLLVKIPGTEASSGSVSFVGAHFDVVTANREAEGWARDPFSLTVEDGVLYGRGTTDCLGHVALLTELCVALAEAGQRPRRTVYVLFISNEESAPVAGLGLDYVAECGRLELLREGPLYWLDSADFGPTVGTGGVARWELDITGVTGHSGMPHNCVNALELAMATTLELGRWFHSAFPPHAEEQRYGFLSASSFKATLMQVDNRGATTIPGSAHVEGDLRLTPFYDMAEVRRALLAYAEQLAAGVARGDAPLGFPRVLTADGRRGALRFAWKGGYTEGLACELESPALAALETAIADVRGSSQSRRFSMTGALPLVRDLRRRGFDVQITGFGLSESYHAPNERALLGDFRDGFAILERLVLA